MVTETESEVIFRGEAIGLLGWGKAQSAGNPDWKCPDCGSNQVFRGMEGGVGETFRCVCGSWFHQLPGKVERVGTL
jgi:predicted RNA-binding Zn-ribbon protein involved in translation (DUF1610 family)